MKKDKHPFDGPDAELTRRHEYTDLIDQLRRLPDAEPPEELFARVMQQIKPKKAPRWQQLHYRLSQPLTLTFYPLRWLSALVALALLLFFAATLEKQNRPWSPEASEAELNYVLGRSYLSRNESEQAAAHLEKAVALVPQRAAYHFWLGVAYWSLNDPEKELTSYRAALRIDPSYLPAHVYAGHNYMDRKMWSLALSHYQTVLRAVPDHPEALFNTALAYRKLNRTEEENQIWKTYLAYYPSDRRSLQAVRFLYTNGDFSFQPTILGSQRLVLKRIQFPATDYKPEPGAFATLDHAGRSLKQNPNLVLHVVVYLAENARLAEKRAKYLKKYLLRTFPEIESRRIKISWFDVGKAVELNGQRQQLKSAVSLFTESFADI